jgi:hypothetical protein
MSQEANTVKLMGNNPLRTTLRNLLIQETNKFKLSCVIKVLTVMVQFPGYN